MIATLIKLSLIWGALGELWLCRLSSDIKTMLEVSYGTRRLVKECSQQLFSKQGPFNSGMDKHWCSHTTNTLKLCCPIR